MSKPKYTLGSITKKLAQLIKSSPSKRDYRSFLQPKLTNVKPSYRPITIKTMNNKYVTKIRNTFFVNRVFIKECVSFFNANRLVAIISLAYLIIICTALRVLHGKTMSISLIYKVLFVKKSFSRKYIFQNTLN